MSVLFANWTVLFGIILVCILVYRSLIIDYMKHTKKMDNIFFGCMRIGFVLFFIMTAITIVLIILGVE